MWYLFDDDADAAAAAIAAAAHQFAVQDGETRIDLAGHAVDATCVV